MFCQTGYTPLAQAFEVWKTHFIPLFSLEYVKVHKQDLNFRNRFSAQTWERGEIAVSQLIHEEIVFSVNDFFLEQVGRIDLFAHFDGSTYRISSDALKSRHEDYLSEEIMGHDGIEHDIYISDIPTLREWASLPRLGKEVMYFVDPVFWTINSRAFNFISQRIPILYDPFLEMAHRCKEQLDEDDDPTYEPNDMWALALKRRDQDEEIDETEFRLAEYNFGQYDYLHSLNFPNHHLLNKSPFEAIEGASLCFTDEDWKSLFNSSRKIDITREILSWDNRQKEIPNGRPRLQEDAAEAFLRHFTPENRPAWKEVVRILLEEDGINTSERTLQRALRAKKHDKTPPK